MRMTGATALVAALVVSSAALRAQAPEPTYILYSYMKVAPGKEAEYEKLERAWKKIHAEGRKAGRLDGWALLAVASPSGSATQYNYVTRNVFNGRARLAASFESNPMPADLSSLLTPAEIALVNRTNEIRTLVKNEVWSIVDQTAAEDWTKANISVFNYFSIPEGKSGSDHVKAEREIWKPLHAARIKDGSMKGWFLLNMELPFGAALPYSQGTVDVYTDMKQYLQDMDISALERVHPGRKLQDMLDATSATSRLVRGEVRMVVDRLQ